MNFKNMLSKMSELSTIDAPVVTTAGAKGNVNKPKSSTGKTLLDSKKSPKTIINEGVFKDMFEALTVQPIPADQNQNKQNFKITDPSNPSATITTTDPAVVNAAKNGTLNMQKPGSSSSATPGTPLQSTSASTQPQQTMQEDDTAGGLNIKDFKPKLVPGLYHFNNYDHPDGHFIQTNARGEGVFQHKNGTRKKFDNIKQLKSILANEKLSESWDTKEKIKSTGQFKNKTIEELKSMLAKLKKSGPHAEGTKENKRMKEIMFAIRAKKNWKGGVKEGDMPMSSGKDTMGAGLGAGRSQTTLEASNSFPNTDEPQDIKKWYVFDPDDRNTGPGDKTTGFTVDELRKFLKLENYPTNYQSKVEIYEMTPKEYREAFENGYKALSRYENKNHLFLSNAKPPGWSTGIATGGYSGYNPGEAARQRRVNTSAYSSSFGGDASNYRIRESNKMKKKIKENINHQVNSELAARLAGRADGLKGHRHAGSSYPEGGEQRAYHEGYKMGLDECYGMMEECDDMPMSSMEENTMEPILGLDEDDEYYDDADSNPAKDSVMHRIYSRHPDLLQKYGPVSVMNAVDTCCGHLTDLHEIGSSDVSGWVNQVIQELEHPIDEGNAFTAGLARTPRGKSFSLGGRSITDTSSYDDYAFEAWDRELSTLLKEDVEEFDFTGEKSNDDNENDYADEENTDSEMSDDESDKMLNLLKAIKDLGIFNNADAGKTSIEIEPCDSETMDCSDNSEENASNKEDNISVVDDHDGMMALIKKMVTANAGPEKGVSDVSVDDEALDESYPPEDDTENSDNYPDLHPDDEEDHGLNSDDDSDFDDEETADPDEAYEKNDPKHSGYSERLAQMYDRWKDNQKYKDLEETETEDQREFMVAESRTECSKCNGEGEITCSACDGEGCKACFDNGTRKCVKCNSKGFIDNKKSPTKEKIDEWANLAGPDKKGTDAQFEQDIDFMTKVISGGLNKQKSTGQTTGTMVATKSDAISEWQKLAGITTK